MKRIKALIFMVILAVAGVPCADAMPRYDESYKSKILSMVVSTNTMAVVLEDGFLQAEPSYLSKTVASIKKNSCIEILRDVSESWYLVENADECAVGWVPARFLEIFNPQTPLLPEMSKQEIEAFANIMDFPTDSGFFIWTDIARQKTHILQKSHEFTLVKSFDCATGKSTSPTTRGFFTINGRGDWFYSKRLKSGGKYWVRFNETYLFHSYAMDKNKKITDNVLGERRSSGCVRLSVENAKWLYENVPDGTTVFIY